MEKLWKCPRCKRKVRDYPALSRRDNKTNICDRCGTEEALIDFFGPRGKRVLKNPEADARKMAITFEKENAKLRKKMR